VSGQHGTISDEIASLNALAMKAKAEKVATIRALPFVKSVSQDQPRGNPPVEADLVGDLAAGANVWNLDAINVTDKLSGDRKVPFDGTGVYVAVLDTGLLPFWPFYFEGKNIDTEHAVAFGGLGNGNNPIVPNKWENDVDAHGTHVSSIILGFKYFAASTNGDFQVNGVAPAATLIPVKVLNQNGSGTSFMVAKGITYIADLFDPDGGELAGNRVVINLSLSGSVRDDVEKEALDYAAARNVVIVAAAGNAGPDGAQSFPSAYPPVIAVASPAGPASGTIRRRIAASSAASTGSSRLGSGGSVTSWPSRTMRRASTSRISLPSRSPSRRTRSGRLGPGLVGRGSLSVEPGQAELFFVGGTSQATPHVTGIVALMLQKNPGLPAADVEGILEGAALPLPDNGQQVRPGPGLAPAGVPPWGLDGRAGAASSPRMPRSRRRRTRRLYSTTER
jgi:subtilisin family serine protease